MPVRLHNSHIYKIVSVSHSAQMATTPNTLIVYASAPVHIHCLVTHLLNSVLVCAHWINCYLLIIQQVPAWHHVHHSHMLIVNQYHACQSALMLTQLYLRYKPMRLIIVANVYKYVIPNTIHSCLLNRV